MLKKMLKTLLLAVGFLLILLVLLPVAIVSWGPESVATSIKVMLSAVGGYSVESPDQALVDHRFELPEGFSLSVYATGLGRARMLEVTQQGDLLVSIPSRGEVVLLAKDQKGDRRENDQRVILTGLTRPHGLELVDGLLFVAESHQVGVVAFNEQTGQLSGQYKPIITGLGDGGNHWTKSLRQGADGWMYLSSGSTCNVCKEEDTGRAAISRFNINDVKQQKPITLELFATGLRNSVGMDWSPWDDALYATDNGRDLLGDDYPPCELNKIVANGFYGWPYINGFAELDPDMGAGHEGLLSSALSPVHGFKAHNAPLGMRFIGNAAFPEPYQRAALVALHGSWNRSTRDGYKVVSLHWQPDGTVIEKDFLTGFLREAKDSETGMDIQGDEVIGRPVDIAQAQDGVLYVSDDYSGTIYRIAYNESIQAKGWMNNNEKPRVTESLSFDEESLSDLADQGQRLFSEHRCMSCHSAEASESGVFPSLANVAERYSDAELADFFLSPTPPMPLYGFDESQRQALAVFLRRR